MKLFKKNENKKTTKLPMTKKVKKGFRYYCMAVMAMTFVLGTSVTAFAANDPIQVVNNLSDFIFGLVRAVGMIMLGFGIVQIGLSLKSHDPSQRANGFLTLAGGVVITFAKEILTLITGKKEQLTFWGKLQYIRIFKICCELFAKIHSIP